MSQIISTRCDRCGCTCKDKSVVVYVHSDLWIHNTEEVRYDFCPECSRAFDAALCIVLGIKPKEEDLKTLRSMIVRHDG